MFRSAGARSRFLSQLMAAGVCCCLSAAMLALPLMLALPAPATAADRQAVVVSGTQQSRTLRLGLNKSAVLKLPAVAKDVIVGNPDLVEVILKNRSTAYLFARNVGQTNIFFLDAAGQQILQLDLDVTLDARALKALLDRSLPGNQIDVDSTGKDIVLKGTVANAEESKMAEDLVRRFLSGNGGGADNFVNLMKVASGDQVMLKVRVVELKRSLLKELGINLENGRISIGNFNFDFASKTYADKLDSVLAGAAGFKGPAVSVDAKLRALELNGLATVLAEPNLTAVSGAEAKFLARGQYPYESCDLTNNNVRDCTVLFKDYGISLNFKPTVLAEGRIALKIQTQVSDLAQNEYSGSQPVIDTRLAETSVEIPSGGSMALAGLIKNTTVQSFRNVPGIRKVPIIGALFSSQSFKQNQSELVVIVTPYIVGPTGEAQLATPIDRFNPPTDSQQIFLGRMNKVYGLPDGSSGEVYHGQVGHIVE